MRYWLALLAVACSCGVVGVQVAAGIGAKTVGSMMKVWVELEVRSALSVTT
jgi:hypothetical protein